MQTTTNYGLKKPELIDNVKIADFNDNADIIDNALTELKADQITLVDEIPADPTPRDADTLGGHSASWFATAAGLAGLQADYVYQPAGGTATAITLTIHETLSDGFPMTFIASAANNGAATTINGKPFYKPNTTTAPNLITGKAYTVWWSAAGNCFFVKASAEGNTIAGHVLAGDIFSNDTDTGLVGTMPEQGSPTITPSSVGDTLIVAGHYTGGTIKQAYPINSMISPGKISASTPTTIASLAAAGTYILIVCLSIGNLVQLGNNLILFDDNLTQLWAYNMGSSSVGILKSSCAVLGTDGYLYILKTVTAGTTTLYLEKIDPSNGNVITSNQVDSYPNTTTIYISQIAFYNNCVYIGKPSSPANVYEYNTSCVATGSYWTVVNYLLSIVGDNGYLFLGVSSSINGIGVVNLSTNTYTFTALTNALSVGTILVDPANHYLYMPYNNGTSISPNYQTGAYVFSWNGTTLTNLAKLSTPTNGAVFPSITNGLNLLNAYGTQYYAHLNQLKLTSGTLTPYNIDFSTTITCGSDNTAQDNITKAGTTVNSNIIAIAYNYVKTFSVSSKIIG